MVIGLVFGLWVLCLIHICTRVYNQLFAILRNRNILWLTCGFSFPRHNCSFSNFPIAVASLLLCGLRIILIKLQFHLCICFGFGFLCACFLELVFHSISTLFSAFLATLPQVYTLSTTNLLPHALNLTLHPTYDTITLSLSLRTRTSLSHPHAHFNLPFPNDRCLAGKLFSLFCRAC